MPQTPTIPALPSEILDALQVGLPSFRSFQSADSAMRDKLLESKQGLQVLVMGVPEVLPGGAGLKGARESGWRIIVSNGEDAIAADIYTTARGGDRPLREGSARVASIRQGEQVHTILKAIATLPAQPPNSRLPLEAFHVALLIMPGLFTDALLLRPQDPASSPPFIVPYHTLVDGIELNRVYAEQELIAQLRPVAQKWADHGPTFGKRANCSVP